MPCIPIRGGYVCEIEYVTRAEEAARRIRRGERQLYCSTCGGLWRWPEECAHPDRLSGKSFRAMVRCSRERGAATKEASDGQ